MRPIAWLYVLGMIVLASALSVATFIAYLPSPQTFGLFLILTLVASLMRVFVIEAPRYRSYEGSTICFVASILLLPPFLFVLVVIISHLVEWAKEHWIQSKLLRNWYIQPFNMAKTIISGMGVYAVIRLTQVDWGAPQTFAALLTCLLIVILYVAINQLLLGTVLFLARRIPFHEAGLARDGLLVEAPLACIGYVTVVLLQYSPFLGLFVLAPIVLIYQGFMLPKLQDEHLQSLEKINHELTIANEAIRQLNDELFSTLAKVFDARDPYVGGHAAQVAAYAVAIASELGLAPERIKIIRQSGYLHDIGKIAIPDTILHKPSKLTDAEFQFIKRHPDIGADLVASSQCLHHLAPLIRYHHERWDGRGYPAGLMGEEIPLEARILNISDSVEAMASDRPYHRAMSLHEIITEVQRCAGSQFEPAVVEAFVRIAEREGTRFVVNSARTVAAQQAHSKLAADDLAITLFAEIYSAGTP
ncbi:MAG: HD-GYP domain-containing protein [Chloroflexi bacterium]|nr:HD-GYP domain-containing protein [Chloroflexota bacterium]